jgi:hypothetical protein
MVKVSFWGGPKDGELVHQNSIPKDTAFWFDQKLEVDEDEFNSKLRNDPRRTIQYHMYELEQIEHDKYRYVFKGLV